MNNFRYFRKQAITHSIEPLLALRALFFIGNKYVCPCCGWRLRAFTHGGTSLRVRHLGYCPRCNSKARHRRWWLFLQENTNIFTDPVHLFQASPNYCLSRRFIKLPNIHYVGVDHNNHQNICIKTTLPALPLPSNVFDIVICIHVLEHIEEDRRAIHELYRILKPGGWAGISAPIRLDQKTYEDPTITTPEERDRAFGETVHVRYYGYDLADRLEEAGFRVKMHPGKEVDLQSKQRHGLREDENIFYCTKC